MVCVVEAAHWEVVEVSVEPRGARVALAVVGLVVGSHLRYCWIRYCSHAHLRSHSQYSPLAPPPYSHFWRLDE
jgi:hypothetical protein